uniref:Nebulin-related-anchoring protein-like n=1 Tax=Sinocyclocheilus grahami TaxID=75366 RepID=A0A672KUC9_SINGR
MNVQKCARCGFVVYPAEKINLIGQNWHKACFHCEVCKMVLTANNFVSHQKRPYCQVHNPKNNTFTSVYETPVNINAKKQSEAASESLHKLCFLSVMLYVDSKVKYTEEFEQSKGKGSFPAMITPGYAMAKKANTLASNVEYKKGHEERMSKYTTVTDAPDVLLAKNQGKVVSDYVYTGEYEQQRGKGSFPAHFTPGYQVAKKAGEMASKVKHFSQHAYTEEYEQQKGKGSFPAMITPGYQMAKKAHDLASDVSITASSLLKWSVILDAPLFTVGIAPVLSQSGFRVIMPQFKNVSKMAKYTSDNKYKENYTNHMKGHYEDGGIDKKTMHAMNVRKLASNIAYKSEYEQEKHMQSEYNYPATITPSYQSQKKLEPLKDKNYRQHIEKLKFSQVTDTPEIVQARINAHQLSNLNYKANYEKTKTQYTLSQDTPELKKAKANAELASDIKYKDNWEKNKSKACDFGLDTLTLKAAKASRDLASDIKYKEAFTKNKDKAIGMDVSDSKTLHSLRVAKLSSEVAYKKDSKETQSMCHLPLDMVNLSHAKKAQALASDLDYRKKLHDYTVLPDDMKVQQAKKAYQLQSDNQYRSDLTWMKGVGWEADGCLDVEQAKKAGEQFSEKKYRQKPDSVKFTQVADTPSIIHAKKSQELQSGLAYKAGTEQTLHQYTISKDEPLFKQAKANAELLSEKTYKSSWEEQREKGFELGLDSLSILAAKATRDLASDVKYKQEYEMTKGKMIGVKTVSDDSQMAHSSKATKLQSGLNYKKEYEDTKTKYSTSLDMLTLSHAKKAQELATEKNYKTFLHKYTLLPTDMKVEWAKKAYGQQSDKKYRSDLNWMKGVGWETTGSLDIQKARKATDLASEKKYRQDVSALKFTSIEDTPEMVQAKISSKLVLDRLYREKGENEMHKYTLIGDIPEHVQAKINAMNLSEVKIHYTHCHCYGGYKLRLDAIPFQAAKSSAEILSDQKYKAQFEKTKGKMIGLKGLQDDINIAHSVHATNIQSDLKYKKDSSKMHSQFHLPMDMLEVLHAKKAQSLVSDQDYRLTLHKYTTLPDDLKVQAAKRAYELQSENIYRSDLNYLRGAAWIATGALQIEGSKRATDLISEKVYKKSGEQVKSAGYDLRLDAIPFQTAKASREIASDFHYKEAFVKGKGQQVGFLSVEDDPKIRHSLAVGKLQSDNEYKKQFQETRSQFKIHGDQPEFLHAKKSQAQLSNLNYRQHFHDYTCDPNQLNVKHAKQAYQLQSDVNYKSDLNWIKGVGWTPPGSLKAEMARRAAELGLAEGVTTDEAIAKYQQLMVRHNST